MTTALKGVGGIHHHPPTTSLRCDLLRYGMRPSQAAAGLRLRVACVHGSRALLRSAVCRHCHFASGVASLWPCPMSIVPMLSTQNDRRTRPAKRQRRNNLSFASRLVSGRPQLLKIRTSRGHAPKRTHLSWKGRAIVPLRRQRAAGQLSRRQYSPLATHSCASSATAAPSPSRTGTMRLLRRAMASCRSGPTWLCFNTRLTGSRRCHSTLQPNGRFCHAHLRT
mmetsp:Transcript_24333/g.84552  ORF Transcript_24333/g.84552 Transcript_24333/m.84552 type:complete len:223 (+) Transcript_24333:509-1177(+)